MLAFVHIGKNAGTSWTAVLRRNFGVRHFDSRVIPNNRVMTAADLRAVQQFTPNLCSIAGHEVRPYSDLHKAAPGIRYYTFLRHPVPRLFSLFQFNMYCCVCQGEGPWSEGELQQALAANISESSDAQTFYLSASQDADAAIGIIRERMIFAGLVERFDESVVLLRRLLDRPSLDCRYRRLNMSNDRSDRGARVREAMKPINEFIAREKSNPKTLERVERANVNDARLYAHVSKILYPRWVADYGGTLQADLQEFLASCQDASIGQLDSLLARAHRNLVLKPMKWVWFPNRNALPAAA